MNPIEITGQETATELSDAFSRQYEFLKLHFFKTSHTSNEPSARKEIFGGETLVGAMKGFVKSGLIDINPDQPVSKLEQSFSEKFGLNVQVFRRSGSLWLETSATDHLSLKEQNELGREKSFPVGKSDNTDFDYD